MPDVKVRIFLVPHPMAGLAVKVSPDKPVHVSASRGESVVWLCDDGTATIQFDGGGGPFLSPQFECPRGGFVGSGLPLRGIPGEQHKYTVTVVQTGNARAIPPLDPIIIVDNGG
jgi:hypothetical protein